VAEEALLRFQDEITRALTHAGRKDPLAKFRAIGLAYVRWAMRNPSHFKVISSREIFDFDSPSTVRRDNDAIIAATEASPAQARVTPRSCLPIPARAAGCESSRNRGRPVPATGSRPPAESRAADVHARRAGSRDRAARSRRPAIAPAGAAHAPPREWRARRHR